MSSAILDIEHFVHESYTTCKILHSHGAAPNEFCSVWHRRFHCTGKTNLIQNSQAVKKVCGPQKGYGEKRCEIQGGGQEMAVMVG